MAVREGLLSLLVEGPRHGYQLKSEFEALTGGVWPLNVGQVYSTLDRLERDGMVITHEADGQKTYAITPVGVDVLGDWWETTPADEPPARDELILKVLMAVGSGGDRALAVVTQQRTAVVEMLQRRRRLNKQRSRAAARAGDALAAELMTDALVVRAEADLRWLEMCEARLLQQAASADRGAS
jgi:DNA-binding PadR family transcriptional regulator